MNAGGPVRKEGDCEFMGEVWIEDQRGEGLRKVYGGLWFDES